MTKKEKQKFDYDYDVQRVLDKMFEYEELRPDRIHHLLKVHAFAKRIAEASKVTDKRMYIIEIAALMHDVGIKKAMRKYGRSPGFIQQLEGPPIAREILEELEIEPNVIDRVCFLISKHHTYEAIKGIDWQILVEADFLVNAYEEEYGLETIHMFRDSYFRTELGKKLLSQIYG